MKNRRILSILLCLCLLTAMLCQSAAASASFFFVAVDDAIPLTLTAPPHSAAAGLYVPYTVFDATPGGVVPAYSATDQTLVLFTRTKRLIFDLAKETVTDEEGNSKTALITYRNGLLYIPIALCTSHFGLSYTLINSKDGYPVLRFTTGAQVYDDTVFIEKAESLISLRVNQAENEEKEPEPPIVQPRPPVDDPPQVEDPPAEPGSVYLAVTNAATMADAATVLARNGLDAAFFLTAEEVEAAPELVRLLYVAGYPIGLTVSPEETDVLAALRRANKALDRVLNTRSVMALLTAEQAQDIDSFVIFVRPETVPATDEVIAGQVQGQLLPCGEEAVRAITALKNAGLSFRLLRETTVLPVAEEAPTEENTTGP